MPTPRPNEAHDAWMSRCIPVVKKDGTAKTQEQAVAICLSMWKKRSADTEVDEMNDVELSYDEADRCATLVLANGRPFKLTNVSRVQAEAFVKRYRTEAAAMAARGQSGDPLSLHGPAGIITRGAYSESEVIAVTPYAWTVYSP